VKAALFSLFRRLSRAFAGRGLRRVPGAAPLFRLAYRLTRPRGIVEITCHGQRFAVNSADDGIATPLLVRGEYEPGETALFERLLAPGLAVADVGANFGYYSLIAAAGVGERGVVYAFEPEPASWELLLRNIEANGHGNTVPRRCALSDREGETVLHRDKVNFGRHSLGAANLMRRAHAVTVPTTTLDRFLEREAGGRRLDLLKIDVQGAEALVLGGAKRTLERDRPKILLEFWPFGLRNLGADPETLLLDLTERGYRVHLISEHGETEPVSAIPSLTRRCDQTSGGQGHVNLLLTAD
jgi:FkbM family methyltransferase